MYRNHVYFFFSLRLYERDIFSEELDPAHRSSPAPFPNTMIRQYRALLYKIKLSLTVKKIYKFVLLKYFPFTCIGYFFLSLPERVTVLFLWQI